MSDRLQTALSKQEESKSDVESEPEDENKIITTEEEIEGFHIVKSIIRKNVDISRIFARDTQSYFGILLDDNNRKPICRLHLSGNKKYLGILDKNKNETKILINNLNEIYKYSSQLIESLKNHEN